MNSVILRTVTRALTPALLLYSVVLLMAGHNNPGGGFVGGLVAASAFALYSIAYTVRVARRAVRVDPRTLIGGGLFVALSSGVLSLLAGVPFMTGLWTEVAIPGLGHLAVGTPVLFDIGVYLLVVGVALTILFPLTEK
jgi:multicomponent Na+:H+ antiporter subunit B